MLRPYRAVLFDMDGTLLDSYEANAGTGRIIMERFGFAPPEGIPMRKFIGPPLEHTYGRWYHWREGELEQVLAAFRALYEERKFLCTVYPGIFPLLAELRRAGIVTAMATLKRQTYAELLAERFGLMEALDRVQGREPDRGVETKADVIHTAMERLGVTDPRQVVMVGDSGLDQEGAREAGVDFIAVYYGFGFSHDPGDEADPALCAYSAGTVAELRDILLGERAGEPTIP